MSDFQAVFNRLKEVMGKFENELTLTQNEAGGYSLNTRVKQNKTDFHYFGGVQIKKNYVSYHLMGVYMFPDLLNDISLDLRKRMQGKSCFNFKNIDEPLLAELATLTEKSFERMRQGGQV